MNVRQQKAPLPSGNGASVILVYRQDYQAGAREP